MRSILQPSTAPSETIEGARISGSELFPDELAKIKAAMASERARTDRLFDLAESLIAENRRLLDQRSEYAGLIARQRKTIADQARLIGITPRAQLHLHESVGGRARAAERALHAGTRT